MDPKLLVGLAFKISIFATVFGFGLHATKDDLLYLIRRPGLLVRSLLAIFVIMPVVAYALARFFPFRPTVEIALMALAISPLPPLLPGKQAKAGGQASYGLGLMAILALLSLVLVPLLVEILDAVSPRDLAMSPRSVAGLVLTGALLPLAAGMLVRALAPGFAERIAKPVALVAKVLLALAALVLLVVAAPAMWALVGDGTILALVLFLVIGFAVGHLLGGPDPEHSTVLALATACRHPAIALGIAAANFPDLHFGATILLYVLLGAIVGIPYLAMQKKRVPAAAPG
ncbi:MAG: bile acid:sodium symporter family protein [Candidatus Eiseniibacteriota bacterium]